MEKEKTVEEVDSATQPLENEDVTEVVHKKPPEIDEQFKHANNDQRGILCANLILILCVFKHNVLRGF